MMTSNEKMSNVARMSHAYQQGQIDMREKALCVLEKDGYIFAVKLIRSLPIEESET